jgi:hypothetical protein
MIQLPSGSFHATTMQLKLGPLVYSEQPLPQEMTQPPIFKTSSSTTDISDLLVAINQQPEKIRESGWVIFYIARPAEHSPIHFSQHLYLLFSLLAFASHTSLAHFFTLKCPLLLSLVLPASLPSAW